MRNINIVKKELQIYYLGGGTSPGFNPSTYANKIMSTMTHSLENVFPSGTGDAIFMEI